MSRPIFVSFRASGFWCLLMAFMFGMLADSLIWFGMTCYWAAKNDTTLRANQKMIDRNQEILDRNKRLIDAQKHRPNQEIP